MAIAVRPVMKDLRKYHDTAAFVQRVENAIIDETAAQMMTEEYEKKQGAYKVKSYSEKNAQLIERVNLVPNRSTLDWNAKGAEIVAEAKKQKEAEEAREKALKNKKWDQPQPWDQDSEETFDSKLERWTKQSEELARDWNK